MLHFILTFDDIGCDFSEAVIELLLWFFSYWFNVQTICKQPNKT